MISIFTLTKDEKEKIYLSIEVLKKNIDFFVIRFYHYLLKTDANLLFQNRDMDKQYQMFVVSLNIIFNHIDNPEQLSVELADLAERHRNYGVMIDHINYFTDSFMVALQEVFDNNLDGEYYDIWFKLISDVIKYFQKNIEL